MNREELIEVFEDTEKQCKGNGTIGNAAKMCIERTWILNHTAKEIEPFPGDAEIKVTNLDTFSAARKYAKDEDNFVAVLNFASATNPGGGVTKGSTAQEECLCRCSTLYPALNQKKCFENYYNINRNSGDNRGSDKIIYTRDVLVFKDSNYEMLEPKDMFYVDVITCAAPNLRDKPKNAYNPGANKEALKLSDEELYDIHVRRARNIFYAARNNDITHLILGAFGCGAFKNNPEVVAKAYKKVIEEYKPYFDIIEFAIIGKNDNYDIFKRILLDE